MTSFLIKAPRASASGFTLLEMLVVILLVSLLASLLMQGFIYMSGIYQAVERRQIREEREELLNGWLRDSVHGLVNGVHGDEAGKIVFAGDTAGFSGVSLGGLSGRYPGLPIQVSWLIKRSDNKTLLLYSEAPLYGGEGQSYVIREWPDAQMEAHWSYLYEGQWTQNFPQQTSVFKRDDKNVLPRAIALIVHSVPQPLELIISVRSSPLRYTPPVIEGVL